jgi:hypothetical protein
VKKVGVKEVESCALPRIQFWRKLSEPVHCYDETSRSLTSISQAVSTELLTEFHEYEQLYPQYNSGCLGYGSSSMENMPFLK